ncbi:MAG TPA: site-specific integrase [Pyrinomonadaceae bacterium]|mgnify:CR=1 FL=1|nr:site-specific integrase [Pyrinomonadaceae bacterium]
MSQIKEFLSGSISTRTKWNRSSDKKLSRKAYVARFFYLDETGKRREKTKEFDRKKDAEDHLRSLRASYERSGGREVEASMMTVNDLADHYEKHYAKAAEYVEDRKVAGLRSLKPVQGYISSIRVRFGKIKLAKLTYGDIRDFQLERLKAPVVKTIKQKVLIPENERIGRRKVKWVYQQIETPRKIASVNRELMTLRRMLNVAVSESWIPRNPINSGHSLINMSNETLRSRIISIEEENRLLSACETPERSHLRAIIVCLLDTGLRLNEALTLTWDEVDLAEELINVRALNSKTAKPKTVPISNRLKEQLIELDSNQSVLHKLQKSDSNNLVFGIKSNVNRSWRTARKLAGLEDVRLHDLRHTFGTRLDRSGFSQAQIARLLGHQQVHTTFRYTNPDRELIDNVKALLNK